MERKQSNPVTNVEKAFFRPKDAAVFLGCSKSTLARLEKQGKLPQRKRLTIGWVGWKRETIVEFLESMIEAADSKETPSTKDKHRL